MGAATKARARSMSLCSSSAPFVVPAQPPSGVREGKPEALASVNEEEEGEEGASSGSATATPSKPPSARDEDIAFFSPESSLYSGAESEDEDEMIEEAFAGL